MYIYESILIISLSSSSINMIFSFDDLLKTSLQLLSHYSILSLNSHSQHMSLLSLKSYFYASKLFFMNFSMSKDKKNILEAIEYNEVL